MFKIASYLLLLSCILFFFACDSHNIEITKKEMAQLDSMRIADSISNALKIARFAADSIDHAKAQHNK
jgi:hypothetical protein